MWRVIRADCLKGREIWKSHFLMFLFTFFFIYFVARRRSSLSIPVFSLNLVSRLSLFFPGKLESISKIDCQGITSRLFPLYVNPLSRALHNILLPTCMCKVNLYFTLFLHSLWRDKEEEEEKKNNTKWKITMESVKESCRPTKIVISVWTEVLLLR